MQSKINHYSRILYENREADFFTPCEQMVSSSQLNRADKVLLDTTAYVTGPVLVSYVLWLLQDAMKNGIRRLYFLARDGYILHSIAKTLCKSYQLDIECRYFYCSRYSLRKVLFFIDQEEALNKLCINGNRITPEIVLERAGLDHREREQILTLLDIKEKNGVLSENGLSKLRDTLVGCESFLNLAAKKSGDVYSLVHGYFKQEGLFDVVPFAIVDTGWLGSMQRSIRQIMQYSGCDARLYGYYFGMFERGKIEDGTFSCYYFSKDRHYFRCVNFNNNLFECLCTANHGMTVGYQKQENNKIEPILKPFQKTWNLELQLQTVDTYTKNFVRINRQLPTVGTQSEKMVRGLLKSFMVYPSCQEANVYGSIPFCDDLTEIYMVSLAEKLTSDDLKQQKALRKIFRKLFIKRSSKNFRESFWIQGTISRYDYQNKPLLRFDIQVSEWAKYIKKYLKIV